MSFKAAYKEADTKFRGDTYSVMLKNCVQELSEDQVDEMLQDPDTV